MFELRYICLELLRKQYITNFDNYCSKVDIGHSHQSLEESYTLYVNP